MTTSQVTRPATRHTRAATPGPESYRPTRRPPGRPGPRRLSARAVVAAVLLCALCALAVTGALAVRQEAGRLGTAVTERAAVAAELRFALADLDAQRANTLAPGRSTTDPDLDVGNELIALITAQQRRAQVSDLLRRLGADAARGGRVRTLFDALGRYDDLSGRAAYVDEQHPDRDVGEPPRTAVSMNVQAGEIMHDTLLPAAQALSDIYERQARDRAAAAHAAAVRWALAVGVLGALTLAYLLWWQRELARDYRRLLNPPLAVATAAVLAITAAGALAFGAAADAVTTAGREGLRPWSALAEARAVAAQAAATESRWFVHDAAFGVRDVAEFDRLTRRLDTLLSPTGRATAAERPAYRDVLTRYGHFRADDRNLRSLKAAGETERAARVLTEVGRGDIAFDFWDFATTLDALAGRQLEDFSVQAGDARGALAGWPAVPAGALGAAGFLVLLGIRPRYAEYR